MINPVFQLAIVAYILHCPMRTRTVNVWE